MTEGMPYPDEYYAPAGGGDWKRRFEITIPILLLLLVVLVFAGIVVAYYKVLLYIVFGSKVDKTSHSE